MIHINRLRAKFFSRIPFFLLGKSFLSFFNKKDKSILFKQIPRDSTSEDSNLHPDTSRKPLILKQIEVERIDIGEPENTGIRSGSKRSSDHLSEPSTVFATSPADKNEVVEHVSATSPVDKNEVVEHQDIDINDLFGSGTPEDDINVEEKDNVGFDINIPQTDDEIADVIDSGDEVDKGPNAAEALRAQVNAEGRGEQTSSSSTSSGSGSSESGSGSGSSSSSASDGSDDGSDEDSVNSI